MLFLESLEPLGVLHSGSLAESASQPAKGKKPVESFGLPRIGFYNSDTIDYIVSTWQAFKESAAAYDDCHLDHCPNLLVLPV